MKKRLKIAGIILIAAGIPALLLSALGLSSCAKQSPELERFQGHWVDLNSDTTLDLSGNQMTVTMSGEQAVYTVKVQKEDSVCWLINADGSGSFGLMSELTEATEEHLKAVEQVFDAEGHQYVFVREAVKGEKLKIQDHSTDLPRTIESDAIVEFSLRFTNRGQYGLSEEWPACRYDWTIEKTEDGTWFCDYMEMYDDSVGRSYSGEVSEAFMKSLAECIQRSGTIASNGYNMGNSASGTDYSLHVIYESGEELKIRATGDAGNSCVFDLEALMQAAGPLLSGQE